VASAVRSTSIGSGASATFLNSFALGSSAAATANNASVVGAFSQASGVRSTALGAFANASATNAFALGAFSTASANSAVAIGLSSVAAFSNSVAIGSNSATTAADQVTLGGAGSSVRIGDIAALTAAQTGPVNAVTAAAQLGAVQRSMAQALAVSDAQFDALSGRVGVVEQRVDRVNRNQSGGIAASMALGETMIVPGKNVSLNFNLATYRGEQGFAGTIAARVAPKVYVSGGSAGSSVKGSSGRRVGLAIGF
jgi:autotransporter adhesin